MSRILIFANGVLPDPEKARGVLQPGDYVICADGGTRHALALGLRPNLLVGDLDSVSDEHLRTAEEGGAEIMRYSSDKNETDLELALRHARERRPDAIVIVAALGARLDQTLGNLSLLSDPSFAALDVCFDDGLEEAFFCYGESEPLSRTSREIRGRSGDVVSLIPWGAPVEGVHTKGLKWPLSDEVLYPEKTRGVSNEMISGRAAVRIRSGRLLIVHRRGSSV